MDNTGEAEHGYVETDPTGRYGRVTSPGGNVVHSLQGTSGDKFEFKAPQNGIYKFCFCNLVLAPETVSFHIHVRHIPTEYEVVKDEHLGPINVRIVMLREALKSIIS
ncbi:Transmembrane emp24 domain-containing protein [Quillaja saponaria]|uniref:Transmembrane emp24 domain-containing protein n=1 Tax=Quillaja saponaria TaxID=32244 RepID=A0AAD7KMB2_QUISA|nr:Transmembrane emp24 domain-containing protein [Quillaja saponaria]